MYRIVSPQPISFPRTALRKRGEGVSRGPDLSMPSSVHCNRLPRIDLDDGQRRVLVRMTSGGWPLRMDVDRKSPGRVSREPELGDGACGDAFFDVITVKMEDKWLIARPPQFYDIAFVEADEPHGVGDAAMLDLDVKGELRRRGADAAGGDQQQRQCPSW